MHNKGVFSPLTALIFVLVSGLSFLAFHTYREKYFYTPKAEVTKQDKLSQKREKPEFAKDEILIKFKSTTSPIQTKNFGKDMDKIPVSVSDIDTPTLPSSLRSLNQKYTLRSIEKVFKGSGNPQEKVAEYKKRFGSTMAEEQRKINEADVLKNDLSRTYRLVFNNKDIPVEEIIRILSLDPAVQYAEPNYIFKTSVFPNDPYFTDTYPGNVGNRDPSWNPVYDYQWNLKRLQNLDVAWNISTGNTNIITAITDTGVDYTHEDLGGCTLAQVNGNQCGNVVPGYDFANNDNDPIDDNGHGTHVSGIVAAISNNNKGLASLNWQGKIMPVKGFGAAGNGTVDILSQGIVFAVDNGARVINMSWGNSNPIPTIPNVLKDSLDYAFHLNVLLVAAAGNSNDEVAKGYWPANYKYVVSVSAIDENDNPSSYSNYGKVDISAPGGSLPYNLLSLNAHNPTNPSTYLNLGGLPIGNGYLRLAGTSMAAPHVSGFAALLLAKNPTLSHLEIKSLMESTARGKGTWSVGDERYGRGIMNPPGALLALNSTVDQIYPTAEIYSPARLERIYNTYSITGTAQARDFRNYTLEVGIGKAPTTWSSQGIVLSNNGNSQVSDGVLGSIDTTGYRGKDVVIKLRTTKQSGLYKEDFVSLYIPELVENIGENVQVNNDTTCTVTPAGAYDSRGIYYVVWFDSDCFDTARVMFSKSTDNGATFSTNSVISDPGGTPYYPYVLAHNNTLYVAYEHYVNGSFSDSRIVVKKSSDTGSTFQIAATLNIPNMTKPDLPGRFMEVKADNNGNYLYFSWQAGRAGESNLYVYFARFNTQTNTFEETKTLRTIAYDPNYFYLPNPSIAVSTDGTLHEVWTEAVSGWYKTMLAKSTNNGASFDNPRELFGSQYEHQIYPYAKIHKATNQLYVTFAAQTSTDWVRDVWISKSSDSGNTFSAPYNITQGRWTNPFATPYFSSPITFNSHNDVFVGWRDKGYGEAYVAKADSSITSFAEPILLSPQGQMAGALKLSLISTHSLGIFTLYDFALSQADSRIYSKRVGLVTVPQSPTPSPVNTPTPTLVPSPTPTPTPPTLPPYPTCPSPTPWFSIYFGSVTINGLPAPINTKVWLVNPRGQIVGCQTVTDADGRYRFTDAYGEDAANGIPGMRSGEPVTFYINTSRAQISPSPILWRNDRTEHQVDLSISTPIITPTPTPTPISSFGKAIRFAPRSGNVCSYITIPESNKLLMGDNFTLEFWVNPTRINQAAVIGIVNKRGATVGNIQENRGYNIRIYTNLFNPIDRSVPINQFWGLFKLQRLDETYASGFTVKGSTDNVSINQWHFTKLVKQGNLFNLYVNGQSAGSTTIIEPNILTEQTVSPLYIGAWLPENEAICVYSYFQGDIDEMRISNIARTGTGIPSAPFIPDANTMALWHFDDNTDDSSGNNLNGAITGEVKYISYAVSTAGTSPTRTPTPTPTPNKPPQITTMKLPQGRLNQKYSADVLAVDPDSKDYVDMTLAKLPPGLVSRCYRGHSRGNNSICTITGTPKQHGTFKVNVQAKDNRGGKTEKILPLTITRFP